VCCTVEFDNYEESSVDAGSISIFERLITCRVHETAGGLQLWPGGSPHRQPGLGLADQTMCSNGDTMRSLSPRSNSTNPVTLMQVQELRNLGSVGDGRKEAF
jgi:hypothetical protein